MGKKKRTRISKTREEDVEQSENVDVDSSPDRTNNYIEAEDEAEDETQPFTTGGIILFNLI